MKYEAFWITDKGQIIGVPVRHIVTVIEAAKTTSPPSVFGYSLPEIKAIYKKYGERMPSESYARENIVRSLLERGFVRLRYHVREDSWTIQVYKYTASIRKRLNKWVAVLYKDIGDAALNTGYDLDEIHPEGKVFHGVLQDLIILSKRRQ